MQTTLIIIGFFLLGYATKGVIKNREIAVKWLNNYIVFIAMPSIILLIIPTLVFDIDMLIPAGFAWAWALTGGLMLFTLSRFFNFPRPIEGAALLLVILGNTSFLGYPMVQAFFNDEVLSYAIFYDQLGSFLMLSTAGLCVLAVYAPYGSGHTLSATSVAKRVFSFPPFIALLMASFLPIDALVTNTEPMLNVLATTLMPLALLVIGLQFQPQLLPEHRLPLTAAIVIKMIIAPLFAYGALSTLNTTTPISQATIFEAAMPCMITPGIMAIQAGLSPRFCATLLGYSTLFAFIWLPIVAAFIQ